MSGRVRGVMKVTPIAAAVVTPAMMPRRTHSFSALVPMKLRTTPVALFFAVRPLRSSAPAHASDVTVNAPRLSMVSMPSPPASPVAVAEEFVELMDTARPSWVPVTVRDLAEESALTTWVPAFTR